MVVKKKINATPDITDYLNWESPHKKQTNNENAKRIKELMKRISPEVPLRNEGYLSQNNYINQSERLPRKRNSKKYKCSYFELS